MFGFIVQVYLFVPVYIFFGYCFNQDRKMDNYHDHISPTLSSFVKLTYVSL